MVNNDLISRDEAIAELQDEIGLENERYFMAITAIDAFKIAIMRLKKFPAVDAEPVRHARWICQDEGRTRFMCSNCKAQNYEGFERYCPNCGAKMDLEE